MKQQDHMKVGRYHSWVENGALRLYSHRFGDASGFSCTLSAEEARGLLELLSRHREEIDQVLNAQESQKYHYAQSLN
jgi:hypothetical protein